MTGRARRILAVDDDEVIRLLVRRILELAGHVVETAADGREALERIASARPDLVILDLMMPIMDGWQVLERLREAPNPPPVVVLSAVGDPHRAIRHGAARCVSKPFRLSALVEACEQALAGSDRPCPRREACHTAS